VSRLAVSTAGGTSTTHISYLDAQSPVDLKLPATNRLIKFDVWESNNLQPNKTQSSLIPGFAKRKFICGISMGLLICMIPLAVLTALWIKSSTNDSTSTKALSLLRQRFSVYSAASTSLPSQCFSYSTNNDSTRNVAYGSGLLCDNSLVTGWYRFVQPAGTMIVASVTNVYQCSTIAPGWLNSSYPTTLGQAVTGYVCLNVGGVICQYSYPILITNCSSFYVYFLAPVTICYARYCTT
ncbi:unnamed protein product, partial [Didymodactylos carnosus]